MSKSIMFRREKRAGNELVPGPHDRIAVFIGDDSEHRALAGVLTMRRDESEAFWGALNFMQFGLREVALHQADQGRRPVPPRWASTDLEVEVEA